MGKFMYIAQTRRHLAGPQPTASNVRASSIVPGPRDITALGQSSMEPTDPDVHRKTGKQSSRISTNHEMIGNSLKANP